MMVLLLPLILATAAAFPQRHQPSASSVELQEPPAAAKLYKEPVPIVSMYSEVNHDGNFRYGYESADGTKADQVGELRDFGEDKKGSVASGGYEYIGDDGLTYSVTYVADENGFQAQGAHLPVPPPLPEAIARALAYIAAHPPAPEKHDDHGRFPTNVIAN